VELLAAVGKGDARASVRERGRGLERRVSSADGQRVLSGEVPGVVEAVEDLVEILARDAQPPVIAAAADGDEDAPRACHRLPVGMMEEERALPPFDLLDPRGRDLDPRVEPRLSGIGEQRLLGMDLGGAAAPGEGVIPAGYV
jgi:hypothetical protein